jgi:hypothetical protein
VSKIKKNILEAQNTRTIWKFDSLKKKTDQLYGPPYIIVQEDEEQEEEDEEEEEAEPLCAQLQPAW